MPKPVDRGKKTGRTASRAIMEPLSGIQERHMALRARMVQLRRQLQDLSGRYTSLFELAPIGYAMLDAHGRIEALNQRFSEMLSQPRIYLLGTPLGASVVREDRRRLLEHLRRCRASHGEAISCDLRLQQGQSLDGAAHVQLVSRRVQRDKRIVFLTAAVDMTARIAAMEALLRSEARLREAAERLEMKGLEAKRTMEQMKTLAWRMSQAEQMERQRIARLLHDELQQILVSAQIQLSMAERSDQPDGPTGKARRRVSEAIALSRSLTQQLSPPVLHDAGLRTALVWLARWVHDKHGLRVEVTAPEGAELPDAHARIFLFEAVRELLLNVVKHASTGEAAVLLSQDEHSVLVEVSDKGAGFDPQRTAEEGGVVHFGLASLRERVPLMGGTITLDTAPGRGTRVRLSLPIVRPEAPSALPPAGGGRARPDGAPRPTGTCRKLRVLVVDDHRLVREGLYSLLKEESDIEIVGEAADGREAVIRARALAPDVVVMDVTLPVISGIEATRIIAAEQPDAAIIGMSMHEKEDMANAMIEAGARRYLTKGGPAEDLIEAIREITAHVKTGAARPAAGTGEAESE